MRNKLTVYLVLAVVCLLQNAQAVTMEEPVPEPISVSGVLLETAPGTELGSAASIVYPALQLPDKDFLSVPVRFLGNPWENEIAAWFNGEPLHILSGLQAGDGSDDSWFAVEVEILDYRGQTGELKVTLTNTGAAESELLIAENIQLPEGLEPPAASGGSGDSSSGSSGGAVFWFFALLSVLGAREPGRHRNHDLA